MPVGPGRFRVVTRGGQKVRLHFKRGSNTVDEAKNLKTGATHTAKEFAADRRRRSSGRSLRGRR